MAADTQHWDVGAYVLGVLDPADIESFEAHLAGCDSCADEVAILLPVVSLLPLADAEALLTRRAQPRSFGPTPVPALDASGLGQPGSAGHPGRRRALPRHGLPATFGGRRLAVAAGVTAVVLAGGSFVAGRLSSTVDGSDSPPVAGASPVVRPTTRFTATDPTTGARADVAVATTPWGSAIELTVAGVSGPLRCELIAVGADAHSTVVASWLVDQAGYGVPGQPNPLRVSAATAMTLAATSQYEIRATSPDGQVRTLVSVAV